MSADPTSTPPVDQPPVAEMSDEQLTDALLWWERGPIGNGAHLHAENMRRLTQARSAPPSEGMVLIDRRELDALISFYFHDDDTSFRDRTIHKWRTALAAPSGGPDVE